MDTANKIMMRILDDLYSSDTGKICESYSKYYDSLSIEQSRCQVEEVIYKIVQESKGKVHCDCGIESFTLTTEY